MRHPVSALLCALLVALILFVFNPSVVYQNNVHEFATTMAGLLGEAGPWVLAVFAALFISLLVLDLLGFRRLLAVAFAGAFLLWVQSSFLSFSYGKLDGSGLDFAANAWRSVYEIPLWLTILGLAFWRPDPILRNAGFVAGFLLAAQTALLFMSGAFDRSEDENTGSALKGQIPQAYFSYGRDTNVLHLVLDEFGTEMMKGVLAARPDLAEHFSGFTFYRDAMGLFPTTNVSMHAILTGQLYDYQEPLADQIARELPELGLSAFLGNNGYATHLVAKYYLCQRMGRECRIVPGTDATDAAFNDSLQLFDFGLFRAAPHVVKSTFFGPAAELLQKRFAVGDEAMRTLPYQAVAFLRQAIDKSYRDTELPPQYNFYHVALPHLPAVTDKDCNYVGKQAFSAATFQIQSECAAAITVDLLDSLKQIGAYDDTLIVIHSDHGSWFDVTKVEQTGPGRPSAWDMSRSSALLMVKLPGAEGALMYSDAPASLADVRPTILAALGFDPQTAGLSTVGERSTLGVDLARLDPKALRARRYWGFEWKGALSERDYLPTSNEYSVTGNHLLQSNWMHKGVSSGTCVYTLGTRVQFRADARQLPFCISSGLSSRESEHTWTQGEAVTLQFNLDLSGYAGGSLRLLLRSGAFVPDDTPLIAGISIGDRAIGKLQFDTKDVRDIELEVPAVLVSETIELRISIENPRRPIDLGINADQRPLGLRLYHLELSNL